jgi:hypothetical protein
MEFMGRLLKNRSFSWIHWGLLSVVSAGVLSNCAPVTSMSGTKVNIGMDLKRFRSSALNAGGTSYQLPTDHCYSIHIHGQHPSYNRIPDMNENPDPQYCPQTPSYMGQFSGFYNKGSQVEVTVVNAPLTFDLVAISKLDLGIAVTDSCPSGFSVEPYMDLAENRLRPKPMLNGVELQNFDPSSITILGRATAQITPGVNNITLTGIQDTLGLSTLNPNWASLNGLGMPYFCDDGGGGSGPSELMLVSPMMAYPGMNQTVFSGLVKPFLIFECPVGAASVSVLVSGSNTYTAGCIGGDSNSGGIAKIQSVDMPAAYRHSGGMIVPMSATARDSTNTVVGNVLDFSFRYSSRYYTLSNASYSQTTPIYPNPSIVEYGDLTSGTSVGVRFAGYQPHSPFGDNSIPNGYLFFNLWSASGAGGNNFVFGLPIARTTFGNHRPFDWDNALSATTPKLNIDQSNGLAHYVPEASRMIFNYNANRSAVYQEIDFSDHSTVVGDLGITFSTMAATKILTNGNILDSINAFFSFGTSLFAIGGKYGSGTVQDFMQVPNAAAASLQTAVSIGDTITVSPNFQNWNTSYEFSNGQFILGTSNPNNSFSKYYFKHCVNFSCANFQNYYAEASSGQRIIGTFAESYSNPAQFRSIIARPTGVMINDLPRTLNTNSTANNLDGYTTGKTIFPYTDTTRFFPPINTTTYSTIKPKIIQSVERDSYAMMSDDYPDDILLGLELYNGVDSFAVLYRSFDGGNTWYEVYFGGQDTTFVDSIQILRQHVEYDNNSNPLSVFDSPGVAIIIQDSNAGTGSMDAWKVIWQESFGF